MRYVNRIIQVCLAVFFLFIASEINAVELRTKVHYIKSADGWELGLTEYQSRTVNKNLPQIICLAGMGANHTCWNFTEKISLAEFLCARGYTIWAMDYRGQGNSTSLNTKELHWHFDIDTFINSDLPASVSYINNISKAKNVVLIGHSMGGGVCSGYLETRNPSLHEIVGWINIAGMINFETDIKGQKKLKFLADVFRPFIIADHKIPFIFSGKIFYKMPLGSAAVKNSMRFAWNFFSLENTDTSIVKGFLKNTVSDVGTNLMIQALDSIDAEAFISSDKHWNYSANLDLIDVPVLMIAGEADKLVPHENVVLAYQGVSSQDKTFIIFGRNNGNTVNYGHTDLVMGINSKKEVYPVIGDWLDERFQ